MPDGSEFTFDNKKSEPTGVGVPTDNDSQRSTISSATNSIAAEGTKNNTKLSLSDIQGRKLTKEQQEYFKDSKLRDANESLMVMYHGTPYGDFTTFRRESYFTPKKEYAVEQYTILGGSFNNIKYIFK